MGKWNMSYFKLSVIISIFLPMFIPAIPINEGILKYSYGFPFTYITIYQRGETSRLFFYNFFLGNAGVLMDPLSIFINAIILNIIIGYLVKLFNKIQKKN